MPVSRGWPTEPRATHPAKRRIAPDAPSPIREVTGGLYRGDLGGINGREAGRAHRLRFDQQQCQCRGMRTDPDAGERRTIVAQDNASAETDPVQQVALSEESLSAAAEAAEKAFAATVD